MPIAFIFMLVGAAVLIPTMFMVMSSTTSTIKGTATAEQMKAVISAAKGYISANAAYIEAHSSPTTPYTVYVNTLVQQGYLPNGFMGYSSTGVCGLSTGCTNPYGQTWEVQILQPVSNNLQAVVLSTGGYNIRPKDMGQISSIAGADGGVVGGSVNTSSGTEPSPCASGVMCGTSAGWQIPVGSFSATPGHLAGLIEYNNNNFQSDYLYRVAIPGQPQLNTMNTNLNMGANNINNAQNVNVNQNISAGVPGTAETGYCQTDAQGHCIGQIAAAGQSEGDLPAGWWGGIISRDVYGTATIAAGTNNQVSAYMNSSGQIGGQSEQLAGGEPNGQYGSLQIGSNYYYGDSQNAAVRTPGSFYIQNQNASGPASIAEVNNINASGQVTANYDATLGTAGGSANVGWGCGPNGAIAANANGSGQVLACQGGSWQAMGGGTTVSANGSWSVYLPSYGLWTIYGAIWTANGNSCYSESLYINGTYVNGNPGCDDETVSGVVQEYAGPGWVSMSASGNASNVGPYEIIAWQG